MTTREVDEILLDALLDIAVDKNDRHSAADRFRAIEYIFQRAWLLDDTIPYRGP
jgi:hypothetical protein